MFNWFRGRSQTSEEETVSPVAPQAQAAQATAGRASALDPSRQAQLQEELRAAKTLATNGTPGGTMAALEMVTNLIRETNGGSEQAVLDALRKAKEEHRQVVAAFERPGPNWKLLTPVASGEELNVGESMLGEGGRDQVILDAAEDGSSLLCEACGSLVKRERLRAHLEYWCSALPDDDE